MMGKSSFQRLWVVAMATIKTIKLKRNSQMGETSGDMPESAPEETPAMEPAAEGATQTTAAHPTSTAVPGSMPVVGPKVSGKSYMPYMIMAIVVVVIFLVILGLQYSEIAFFQAPPSVWV